MEKVNEDPKAAESSNTSTEALPADGCCVIVSARDYEQILASAENPPAPNAAALAAAKRFMEKHG